MSGLDLSSSSHKAKTLALLQLKNMNWQWTKIGIIRDWNANNAFGWEISSSEVA